MPRSKKIMVVDDEPGIRSLLLDVLSGEGYKVTLAKDGKDSLDQMRNHDFDLLITDVEMPRVDGIELVKKMKRAGRKEKVIVMTGDSLCRASLKEKIPFAVAHLLKPFHMNMFLKVVSSALSPNIRKNKRGIHSNEKRKKAVNAI